MEFINWLIRFLTFGDSEIESAKIANIQRIYYTALIMAPAHLLIALLFFFSGEYTTPVQELWRIRIIGANVLIFFIEIVLWVFAARIRKGKPTRRQLTIFPKIVILFVLAVGLILTGIDQMVTSNITPFTLTTVIVGTFYFIRPKNALIVFGVNYLLFYCLLLNSGLPHEIMVTNTANGLTTVFIGYALSSVTWRKFVNEVTQNQRLEVQQEQLELMAYHDSLTGLPNRRFLDDVVKKEIALISRGGNNACVVVLDLDNFKKINDTYGHIAGDELLKQLAVLLEENIRTSDVIARLGGEEFIILLRNTDREAGFVVAEKLRIVIKEHDFIIDGETLRITASFGIALLTETAERSNYYAFADKALYEAKMHGKNQVKVG